MCSLISHQFYEENYLTNGNFNEYIKHNEVINFLKVHVISILGFKGIKFDIQSRKFH